MSDIVLSGATRANLLALQNTTSVQSTVQNRLATGKKVNSALDNATSFFTAASFTNRSNSLSTLLDSMSTGVQTLNAANNGITSITKLVAQLRSTAQQALQSASAYTTQAKISSGAVLGSTAADIRGAVGPGSASSTAALNSTTLTSGVKAATTGATATVASLTTAALATTASGDLASAFTALGNTDANYSINVAVTGTDGTVSNITAAYNSTSVSDGSDGKFHDAATLKKALQTSAAAAGVTNINVDVPASGTNSGKLVLTANDFGTSFTITGKDAGGTASTALPTALGLTASNVAPTGSVLKVGDGTTVKAFGYNASATAGDTSSFGSISDLNNKLTTLGVKVTASDAGSNTGKLALTASDFSVGTLTTSGSAATSLGLAASTTSTGDKLVISDGATTQTLTYSATSLSNDFTSFSSIADLNTKLTGLGIKATASDGGAGTLKLAATDSATTLTVSGSAQGGTKLNIANSIAPKPSTLDGKSLTFTTSGGQSITVKFGDPATDPTRIKTLDDLNTRLATIGLSATLDGTGTFSITTTAATASQSFTMAGSATGVGQPFTTTTSTSPTRGGTGADSRDNLVSQYNSLLTQINSLAKDAGFNGINLLAGDTLSLIFNETNTSRIDIAGTSANADGLGLTKIVASDLNDGNSIGSVLSNLDRVSGQLSNQSSRLGSQLAVTQTRQDFTKQMVNTLKVGADNLVNADMNEEGANLLALNTQQQISQQALSLATQSAQAVLQLLRGS